MQFSGPLAFAVLLSASALSAEPGGEQLRSIVTRPAVRRAIAEQWNGLPDLPNANPDLARLYPCLWNFQTPEAMFMLDASAKDTTGLLAASMVHLGNWDECVDLRDLTGPFELTFNGQMCLLTVGVSPPDTAAREEAARAEIMARDDGIGLAKLIETARLKMAACVPDSCKPDHVQYIFQYIFNEALKNYPYHLNVTVNPIECSTKDRPALDEADTAGLIVYIFLGLCVIVSTSIDILVPDRRPILASFSIITNGKKLLSVSGGGDGAISCLHGIRFISMAWVVLGHRYYLYMNMPSINPLYMQDFMDDIGRIGVTNATVSVDSFFVLSGLLVGYLFFKQMWTTGKFNIPMYYIHRYVRLTPALAFMVLFNASLLIRLGWGPMWETSMTASREFCQRNWWNVLLYVNNYVAPSEGCIGQSWYLMVDMQLYWLSPLLMFPMLWWPRLGFVLYGFLCIGGLVSSFVVSYVKEYSGNTLTVTNGDYMKYYYSPAYTRFVPYLVGLGLGYVLADMKVKSRKVRISRPVTLLLWLLAAALMLIPLFLGYLWLKRPLPSNLASAFYNALHRPAWAAGVSLIIFLCSTGHGCCVNTLLSWKGFQLLGRISYCVFLVHMSVQNVEKASLRTNVYMADSSILPEYASDLLIAYLLGAVLSLVTESPFMVLEKEILGGRTGRQRPAPAADATPDPASAAVEVEEIPSKKEAQTHV